MKMVFATAVLAFTLVSGGASAFNAQSSGAVNLRAGPGVSHARLTTIPASAPLIAHYCLPAPAWCQVTYGATTGWASARYITLHHARPMYLQPTTVRVVPLSGTNLQAFRIRLHSGFAQPYPYAPAHAYSGYAPSYGVPSTYLFVPGY